MPTFNPDLNELPLAVTLEGIVKAIVHASEYISRLRSSRRLLLVFLFLAGWWNISSQATSAQESILTEQQSTAPVAAENGFVDVGSGTLNLDFTLGAFTERGSATPARWRVVYSSDAWEPGPLGQWLQQEGSLYPDDTWSFLGPQVVYTGGANVNVWGSSCPYTFNDWTFHDTGGNVHAFPITTVEPCSGTGGTPSGDALAADSSGYHMYVTNYTTSTIYGPDGSIAASVPPPYMVEDSNGNQYVAVVNKGVLEGFTDTAGRELQNQFQTCASPCAFIYTWGVPNSSGGISNYTFTFDTILTRTKFGESGIGECGANDTWCDMYVLQSISLPDGTSYTFKYDCDSTTGVPACGSPTGQSAYYGELISMTLPSGGQVTYGYTNFKDSYGNMHRWLTSETKAGGTWTYTPSVVTTCSSTQVGCQEKVVVTKPSGDTATYLFTLNNGIWPTQIQNASAAGVLSTVNNTWDFSNPCPFTEDINPPCHGAAYIRLLSQTTTLPVASGASITNQTKYLYDSIYRGNIAASENWGYYPGTSPTFPTVPDRATYYTYATIGSNIINRPLTITTCNNTGSSSYCTGGGSMVAQRIIAYDSYGSGGLMSVTGASNHDDTNFGTGNTARGNATQVQDWVSGTSYLTINLSYDTLGNVLQLTDPNDHITQYTWADNYYNDTGGTPSSYTPTAPTYAYLSKITLTATGTKQFGYYYGSGKQAFETDQNGASTYLHYVDPFDRQTGTAFPVGWNLITYPSTTEQDTYQGIGDASPSTGCTSCRHMQYLLDSFGRKTAEKLLNNPSGAIETDTAYDVNGRVSTESHPYIGSSPVYETNYYDGMDRPTETEHPDASAVLNFYGAAVSTNGGAASQLCSTGTYGSGYPMLSIDETGKKRQTWTDGFGNVIEADEPDSNNNLTIGTCYTFNPLNKLTTVAQGTETRTYSYDGLGRMIQEVTPEAGTIALSYSGSGGGLCSGDPEDLCGKTYGAQNQTNSSVTATTTYCYDVLNRLTQKGYGSTMQSCPISSPAVTYTYDQGGAGAHALGRMTAMSDTSGSETYSYDIGGRITQLQKTIGTTLYTLGYQYNVDGQVTQITYPSGRLLQKGYDVVGHLLTAADAATTYVTVPSTGGYNAAEQLLTLNYGNSVTGTFTYSPNRSQLASLSYANVSQTLFALNYFYSYNQTNCSTGTSSDNDQINCITDSVQPGRAAQYTYDPLGRLSSAVTIGSTGYPQWGLSESYDRYGNRLTQTVTAGSAPGVSLSFTANNRPSGYTYDASGNLIVEPLSPPNNYTYDNENRLVGFSGNGGNATYSYDDNGQRVQKAISGGTTTQYVYAGDRVVAEYDNGAAPSSPSREYVYADTGGGPQLIAKIESGATQYYHQDHLSVRLITDGTTGSPTYGETIGQQGHFPFGEPWYQSGTMTKWAFTSYERDEDSGNNSGLDYALARFYNSRVASFCSVDPVRGRVDDPQSWNRYSYARNDPIDATDPTGKFWFLVLLILQILVDSFSAYFASFVLSTMLGHPVAGIAALESPAPVISTPPTFPNGGSYSWGNMIPGYENPNPSLLISDATDQSQATQQQAQLDRDRQDILDSLLTDPDCLKLLSSHGAHLLQTIRNIPINVGLVSDFPNRAAITDTQYIAGNSAPSSAVITINNVSGNYFFTLGMRVSNVGASQVYRSGSERYQISVLLHEIGHATGTLLHDSDSLDNEKWNNRLIQKDCSKTINRF